MVERGTMWSWMEHRWQYDMVLVLACRITNDADTHNIS